MKALCRSNDVPMIAVMLRGDENDLDEQHFHYGETVQKQQLIL
jgi:hypothetical protein